MRKSNMKENDIPNIFFFLFTKYKLMLEENDEFLWQMKAETR
jgi:hypothetical protein